MIRLCDTDNPGELNVIFEIINDSARAYAGVIPADRFHEPYMPMDELRGQVADSVVFWGHEDPSGALDAVMGIQDRGAVTLIRHAYVRTASRGQGLGGALLDRLRGLSDKPFLIGTWADAAWAVGFYQKHGFALVTPEEKDRLLKTYWSIPERQVETSVVLADARWRAGIR